MGKSSSGQQGRLSTSKSAIETAVTSQRWMSSSTEPESRDKI